jgi:hypothetical protein
MPENISGWADYRIKKETFTNLKKSLNFTSTGYKNVKSAVYGDGKILLGNDLEQLLSAASVNRETLTDKNILFNRRKSENGYYYFIVNKSAGTFESWLPIERKASSAALFNPMTGDLGMAKIRVGSDGLTEVYVKIKPDESFIIETFNTVFQGNLYNFYEKLSEPLEISGKWKVEFIEGGPALPDKKEIEKLESWTKFGGDPFKYFSGTAKYSINFRKPAGKTEIWSLNLGKVCESARLYLNGKELAILIGPDYEIIINDNLLKKNNTIEIKVSNLSLNRAIYADRNKVPWKIFYNINMSGRLKQSTKNGLFDASDLQPLESGLIGPVTLTAVKEMN